MQSPPPPNVSLMPIHKKLTCFVCGYVSTSKQDLLCHFSEKHQIGKDYLECRECHTPVRDLKLHYKVHHPQCQLPDGDSRVTHKEWDLVRRREKIRKRKFKEGLYWSQKNQTQMHYRSSWEKRVYEFLERSNDVVAYKAEPFPIRYRKGTVDHSYWPDILIIFKDDSRALVEIKPLSQTQDPINQAKWAYAHAYCESRGWTFRVWTERTIKKVGRLPENKLTKELLCE